MKVELTATYLENIIRTMCRTSDVMQEQIFALRPTKLLIPRSLLRKGMTLLASKHISHMMPSKQRKATRRAKSRMHMSYIYPRWAI